MPDPITPADTGALSQDQLLAYDADVSTHILQAALQDTIGLYREHDWSAPLSQAEAETGPMLNAADKIDQALEDGTLSNYMNADGMSATVDGLVVAFPDGTDAEAIRNTTSQLRKFNSVESARKQLEGDAESRRRSAEIAMRAVIAASNGEFTDEDSDTVMATLGDGTAEEYAFQEASERELINVLNGVRQRMGAEPIDWGKERERYNLQPQYFHEHLQELFADPEIQAAITVQKYGTPEDQQRFRRNQERMPGTSTVGPGLATHLVEGAQAGFEQGGRSVASVAWGGLELLSRLGAGQEGTMGDLDIYGQGNTLLPILSAEDAKAAQRFSYKARMEYNRRSARKQQVEMAVNPKGRHATGVVQSATELVPALAISMVSGGAGAAAGISSRIGTYLTKMGPIASWFGQSSYYNSKASLQNQGIPEAEAEKIASIDGMIEGLTTLLLGGITATGRAAGARSASSLRKFKNGLKSFALDAGGEVVEENIAEIGQAINNAFWRGEDVNIKELFSQLGDVSIQTLAFSALIPFIGKTLRAPTKIPGAIGRFFPKAKAKVEGGMELPDAYAEAMGEVNQEISDAEASARQSDQQQPETAQPEGATDAQTQRDADQTPEPQREGDEVQQGLPDEVQQAQPDRDDSGQQRDQEPADRGDPGQQGDAAPERRQAQDQQEGDEVRLPAVEGETDAVQVDTPAQPEAQLQFRQEQQPVAQPEARAQPEAEDQQATSALAPAPAPDQVTEVAHVATQHMDSRTTATVNEADRFDRQYGNPGVVIEDVRTGNRYRRADNGVAWQPIDKSTHADLPRASYRKRSTRDLMGKASSLRVLAKEGSVTGPVPTVATLDTRGIKGKKGKARDPFIATIADGTKDGDIITGMRTGKRWRREGGQFVPVLDSGNPVADARTVDARRLAATDQEFQVQSQRQTAEQRQPEPEEATEQRPAEPEEATEQRAEGDEQAAQDQAAPTERAVDDAYVPPPDAPATEAEVATTPETQPNKNQRLVDFVEGQAETVRLTEGETLTTLVSGYVNGTGPRSFNVVGQTVARPEDAASLFAAIRSPEVERSAWIITSADGTVKASGLYAIGEVNGVTVPNEAQMSELLDMAGAEVGDKVYFAHNHPSGDIAASREDYAAMRRLATVAKDRGLSFDSIVLDHNAFHHMESGKDIPYSAEKFRAESTIKIENPLEAAMAISSIYVEDGTIAVIGMDAKLRINGLANLPSDATPATIRSALDSMTGVAQAIIARPGTESRGLVEHAPDSRIVDIINVKEDGSFESLAKENLLNSYPLTPVNEVINEFNDLAEGHDTEQATHVGEPGISYGLTFREGGEGQTASIPAASTMLDAQAVIGRQPPAVRKAIREAGLMPELTEWRKENGAEPTGASLYQMLVNRLGNQWLASNHLNAIGISGMRDDGLITVWTDAASMMRDNVSPYSARPTPEIPPTEPSEEIAAMSQQPVTDETEAGLNSLPGQPGFGMGSGGVWPGAGVGINAEGLPPPPLGPKSMTALLKPIQTVLRMARRWNQWSSRQPIDTLMAVNPATAEGAEAQEQIRLKSEQANHQHRLLLAQAEPVMKAVSGPAAGALNAEMAQPVWQGEGTWAVTRHVAFEEGVPLDTRLTEKHLRLHGAYRKAYLMTARWAEDAGLMIEIEPGRWIPFTVNENRRSVPNAFTTEHGDILNRGPNSQEWQVLELATLEYTNMEARAKGLPEVARGDISRQMLEDASTPVERRNNMEQRRKFKVPTHIRVEGRTIQIRHGDPATLVRSMVERAAARMSFVRSFGQKRGGMTIEDDVLAVAFVDGAANRNAANAAVKDLYRTLNAVPVEMSEDMDIGSDGYALARGLRVVTGTVSPLHLTGAAIPNIPEVLGGPRAMVGFWRMLSQLPKAIPFFNVAVDGKEASRYVQSIHATTPDYLHFSGPANRKTETSVGLFRGVMGRVFGHHWVNEFNDAWVGVAGKKLADDVRIKNFGKDGVMRFRLRMLGFTDAEVQQFIDGNAEPWMYDRIVQQMVQLGAGATKLMSERSRMARDPIARHLTRFQSYMQNSNAVMSKALALIADDMKAGRYKAATSGSYIFANMLVGKTLAGAVALALRAFATYGWVGVVASWKEWDRDWKAALAHSQAYALAGGTLVTAMEPMFSGDETMSATEKVGRGLSRAIYPLGLTAEATEFFMSILSPSSQSGRLTGYGKYRNLTSWEMVARLFTSNMPAARWKPMAWGLATMGIGTENTVGDLAMRKYYQAKDRLRSKRVPGWDSTSVKTTYKDYSELKAACSKLKKLLIDADKSGMDMEQIRYATEKIIGKWARTYSVVALAQNKELALAKQGVDQAAVNEMIEKGVSIKDIDRSIKQSLNAMRPFYGKDLSEREAMRIEMGDDKLYNQVAALDNLLMGVAQLY